MPFQDKMNEVSGGVGDASAVTDSLLVRSPHSGSIRTQRLNFLRAQAAQNKVNKRSLI